MKRSVAKISAALLLGGMLLVSGMNVLAPFSVAYAAEEEVISIRADAIEWRYKVENGKLYKRLFNVSKNKWIDDDWTLC